MLPHLVLVVGLCLAVEALQLPPYIKPCAYDDPDLNACALREARNAAKKIVNGDRTYRVPRLDPLIIEELKVDQGTEGQAVGFSIVAYNCSMYGLSNASIVDTRLDMVNRHIEYDFDFPRLEVTANYSARGRVLLVPITGSGIANITVTEVKPTYRYNFTVDKKADGDYLLITDNKMDFKLDGRVYIHLDNLLNGEKVLNDNINTVLNDNWQELVNDVGPSFADALGELMTQVLRGMFSTVSLQNAFRNYPAA